MLGQSDDDQATAYLLLGLKEKQDRIEELEAALKEANQYVDALSRQLADANEGNVRMCKALREIANHPHCTVDQPHDEGTGARLYQTGVQDGHRCAAEIAGKALDQVKIS